MSVIAASMLASMVEQLRERRGPLATLVEVGTRRGPPRASVLRRSGGPPCPWSSG